MQRVLMIIPRQEFIDICVKHNFDIPAIRNTIKDNYKVSRTTLKPSRIERRLNQLRAQGHLPLSSGNRVALGEHLKSTSTLYDSEGNIKLQWIKSDVAVDTHLEHLRDAITELAESLPHIPHIPPVPTAVYDSGLATLYISNDLHIGALMWDKESGEDYDLAIAKHRIYKAYDFLFETSPVSPIAIIADLGDLLEADNDKNMTPKSGHHLSVDGRFPKILRVAYEALIYAITKALQKHQLIYFYNIVGNHDLNAGHAIREVIRVAFKDNPRVIIDDTALPVKYHQHGTVLLQFAHGDGMKMKQAGEVMAYDKQDIFSSTRHRFSHLGHYHVDAVYDGPLCRVESHRNLAPNNHWAHHMGYRRSAGTMKSITYHTQFGEMSRSIYNVES
jgi:hypothetical protein